MTRGPGWPKLDHSQPLVLPKYLHWGTGPHPHKEEEVQPTTAEQEIRAAAPPDPNADKQGKTAEDELGQLAYLFGCLDRYEDTPSRHMKLSGYSQVVQTQYLRGRRDRDGIGGA